MIIVMASWIGPLVGFLLAFWTAKGGEPNWRLRVAISSAVIGAWLSLDFILAVTEAGWVGAILGVPLLICSFGCYFAAWIFCDDWRKRRRRQQRGRRFGWVVRVMEDRLHVVPELG